MSTSVCLLGLGFFRNKTLYLIVLFNASLFNIIKQPYHSLQAGHLMYPSGHHPLFSNANISKWIRFTRRSIHNSFVPHHPKVFHHVFQFDGFRSTIKNKMIIDFNLHRSSCFLWFLQLEFNMVYHRVTVQILVDFIRTLGAFVLTFLVTTLCRIIVRYWTS